MTCNYHKMSSIPQIAPCVIIWEKKNIVSLTQPYILKLKSYHWRQFIEPNPNAFRK